MWTGNNKDASEHENGWASVNGEAIWIICGRAGCISPIGSITSSQNADLEGALKINYDWEPICLFLELGLGVGDNLNIGDNKFCSSLTYYIFNIF